MPYERRTLQGWGGAMKVTDEMVRRAQAAGMGSSEGYMRRVLEVALKDVPDADWATECARSAEKCWAVASMRADAAEAKLAKVREWLDNHHWSVAGDVRTELIEILDGD